jgi:hypothetical protein
MQTLYRLATLGTDPGMQANHSSTACASPFLFFFHQMLFGANRFDADPVLEQTDLISCSVPLIDALDERAGER